MAVAIPDKRFTAPLLILIMLCPIIAQPPIPPKKPVTMLANPCAKDSLFGLPLVSVISSIKLSVRSVSIRPIAAKSSAYGSVIVMVSRVKGTNGKLNSGIPPAIEPKSPTVLSIYRKEINDTCCKNYGCESGWDHLCEL